MNEAFIKAVELLKQASSDIGFLAAVNEEDNYRRVWTRDSAMCGLASLGTGDAELINTFRLSIETILKHQHPAGFIPSNISADEKTISYGGSVGRVDNHAWIIISACNYAQATKNAEWLLKYESHFQKCFDLMTAWEFNGKGLMYVPQSADWADEYYHHGYILFNQLLRLWALRCATRLFKKADWKAETERVAQAIQSYFCDDKYYAAKNERHVLNVIKPYWLMGFNTSEVYTQFDLQANALGLLLKIGTDEQRENSRDYIIHLFNEQRFMIPSFFPGIKEEDRKFEELKNNYAFSFRNKTHEFHNGGLWAVWNGLAATALKPENSNVSEKMAVAIADACKQNDWEFNECHHGLTNEPIGIKNVHGALQGCF